MDQAEQVSDQVAQELADHVLAELRAEQPGHKSPARLRLNRLRSCIEDWWAQDIQDDEREMLVGVCTELLLLCQHLGITGKQTSAGGAAMQVQVEQLAQKHGQIICQTAIKQRVVQLLRAEDESLHLVLASLAHAVRRWIPFDDHDTSSRKGVLSDRLQAEQDVAGVLAKMISMVCEQAGGAA